MKGQMLLKYLINYRQTLMVQNYIAQKIVCKSCNRGPWLRCFTQRVAAKNYFGKPTQGKVYKICVYTHYKHTVVYWKWVCLFSSIASSSKISFLDGVYTLRIWTEEGKKKISQRCFLNTVLNNFQSTLDALVGSIKLSDWSSDLFITVCVSN